MRLIIAAAQAKQQGKELGDLIAALKQPAESVEYRLKITADQAGEYGKNVLQAFSERAQAAGIQIATPSYEGVRLVFPQGWALLRMSLHDPNMPLNIESKEAGGCKEITASLRQLLTGFEQLDISVLDV